jgi:hypothetical protein
VRRAVAAHARHIWAQSFNTKEELIKHFNATEIILSKLALPTKTKPDGITKHKLVRDFLRSRVNSLIHQGERVILPRVSDFVEGILLDVHNLGDFSEDTLDILVRLFGIDISDAFHQIPLDSSEKRCSCIRRQQILGIHLPSLR